MREIEIGSANYHSNFYKIENLLNDNAKNEIRVNSLLERNQADFLKRFKEVNSDFKKYCVEDIIELLNDIETVVINYKREFKKLDEQLKRLY